MNRLLKVSVSLFVGILGLFVVGIGVTEALGPYVWPSIMLGLPAGLVAGIALAVLTYQGVTYREEVADTGRATARTVGRLRATVAGIVGFVVGGGLAAVVLWTQAVGLATAMILELPVGIFVAVLAAVFVSRRDGTSRTSSGSPPANSP
ncbi:hypothetical protein [Natronosalvus caseinilyticus]|uniref:hypothetical protein n=1 Tax=Natronosalvus caseinilyticus TaxID=2953747 RepID=UPI0028ADCD7D|nr:hypothetical protein [Natronosalvus caseinilyticus]